MALVLLIRPFFISLESVPTYPLGLAYLGSVLRKAGHSVKILDLSVLNIKNKEASNLVKRINPDLIGITALSYYFPEMVKLCNHLKTLDIPIVLGGIHVSVLPITSFKAIRADFLIIGEGERTIVELVNSLEIGGDLSKIKGLAYKKNNKLIINERRPVIKNIDNIPFPAWDLLDLSLYNPPNIREFNMFFNPLPALPIFTSRGCPYKCKYCASTNFWGSSIRFRSVENIIEEIEYNKEKFKVTTFEIWDDNFTFSRKRLIKFCKKISEKGIKADFYLPNGIRADTINRKLIKLMKNVGFKGIILAPESGSQKILENVNKNQDLKIVREMANIIQDEGILTSAYFILGLPGETAKTALKTIRYGASLSLNGISYFIFTPLPGSELFKEWSKNVDLEEIDWKVDYFIHHKKKKKTMCELSFKDLKHFQKLGYLFFLLKVKNILNLFKRLNLKNLRLFILTEIRNIINLFFKRIK